MTRFAHQTGHYVERRFGWDCHGLPIEFAIDEQLGIKTREQVFEYGVANYNEACRGIVMKYQKEWEQNVKRLGRWIDMKNDYKTMDLSFMESVWYVFHELWKKDFVYRGYKVMPFSTACHTPLSNFEANLAYKDVVDPAITVAFPTLDDPNVSFLAWTTTPWTLPSNLALNVNPNQLYVKVKDNKTGKFYIVMKALYGSVFPEPKKKKGKEETGPLFTVVEEFLGATLKGRKYVPLFDFYKEWEQKGAFQVLTADYVTAESGTGIVHCAPAFGVDDFETCKQHGVVGSENVPCPVDDNGCFTDPVATWKGRHVKEADKSIIETLKANGRLFHSTTLTHSYPFCWRSDTPLIYKAVPSWFINVIKIKEQLLAANLKSHWVPSHVQEKRFHNWLESAQDWCVSRNRFWGCPMPLWRSQDGKETVCISSVEELQKYAPNEKIVDIHIHKIDHITIPDPRGAEYPPMKRVEEVFDCWFESGSMPFAQQHYPFENKERFEKLFPADFIAEGLDQTRGWFYTLMVLSVALRGVAPFKNVIVNGLVLAEDGKKMSKRLKNYPDPALVVEKYGADAMRLYLINSPVVRAEPLRFREDGVKDVLKDVLRPWFNAYRFCVENCVKYGIDFGKTFKFDMDHGVRGTKNVTDLWILSAAQSLLKFVRVEMAAYRLYTVVPILLKFIEQLTNWYIRFNRKRLKGSHGPEEAFHALCVLHFVLYQQTVLMAPFTPFFTEHVYQNLRLALPEAQRMDSVHFVMIPEPDPTLIRPDVEATMVKLQNVVELARAGRDRRTLPVKTPLPAVHIVHSDPQVLKGLEPFMGYIKDELNVRAVHASSSEADYVRLVCDINDKLCGPKLRNKKAQVKAAVQALGDAEVRAAQQKGKLEVEGFELLLEELVIVRQFQGDKAKLEPSWNDEVLIVLDVDVTPEMVAEGTARSVANVVQKLRKSCGVQATDQLTIYYRIEKEGTKGLPALLAQWSNFISKKIGRPFQIISEEDVAKHQFAGQQKVDSFDDCIFHVYVSKPTGSAPGGQ